MRSEHGQHAGQGVDPGAASGRSATRPLVGALARLRARARRRLVVERSAGVMALAVAAVVCAGLMDYLFRLPMPLRLVLLVGGVAVLWAAVVRAVWPAMKFNPSLVEVALRVERSDAAARAGLEGKLASALELSENPPPEADREMLGTAVRDAMDRFVKVGSAGMLLDSSRAQRGLASLALALLPVLGVYWAWPEYGRLGVARVLTPWRDVSWPKRTMVESGMTAIAHPLDSALTLRAVVTRSHRAPGRTSVSAVYRVVTDGVAGPETRLLLNPPRKSGAGGQAGELDAYEATVSRDTLRVAAGLTGEAEAGVNRVLEVRFATADDETPAVSVALVERPRIVSATMSVTPPDYAEGVAGVLSGERAVRSDASGRGAVGPVLAGSWVELTLALSKPVPTPGVPGSPARTDGRVDSRSTWVASTFGSAGLPAGASLELSATEWRIAWPASESTSVAVAPTDAFGIGPLDGVVYSVLVIPDVIPGAAVVEPAQDEAVLPTAVLSVAGEGRDDVGLAWTQLEARRHRPPTGTAGAPAEPIGEVEVVARVEGSSSVSPGAARAGVTQRAAAELDLSAKDLLPGDELHLNAVASDIFAMGERRHEPVRSATRVLRIISEPELVEQILSGLSPLRAAAERLDQEQAQISRSTNELMEAGADRSRAEGLRNQQRGVGERLRPASDALRRARERAERNALTDQGLRSMLEEAERLTQEAAESAARASEAIERAGATPREQAASPEAQREAEQAQDDVRDDLGRLSDLLSQGQDSFAARQSVQRMMAEQESLTERTREAGERTAGRRPEELSADERAELEQLAQQQQELARRAEQAGQSLRERAERVRASDPAQAEAMQRAADRASREQLAEQMRQAARQTEQNQTGQANQQQQQAQQTLEEMMEELDQAAQRRDEALQRQLADLARAIDGLIRAQEAEIARLGRAAGGEQIDGLAEAMTRLRTNTLSVASGAGAREAREIVERLESAADHQDTAAANLKEPPDFLVAEENERMSLQRLREAAELGEELQRQAQQRDEARKRGELRKKYMEAIDAQSKLRDDTSPMVGKELSRRDRNVVRGLAGRQGEVRAMISAIREGTAELGETTMFDYAHREMDRLAERAGAVLSGGEATTGVSRDQRQIVEILQDLAESLKEGAPPQDEFRQNQGGQRDQGGGPQGGQQPQGVVPPMAELLVLQRLQQRAATKTRELAEADRPDPEDVSSIGKLQRDLFELGTKVIEKLKEQQQGGDRVQPPGGGS